MKWSRKSTREMVADRAKWACGRCNMEHETVLVRQIVQGERYLVFCGPHMTVTNSFDQAKEWVSNYFTEGLFREYHED